MFLYLDTTGEMTEIALFNKNGGFVEGKKWHCFKNQSEELLKSINDIFLLNKSNKLKLKGIFVNPGPGLYTGQRVGLSTANALAFSLNIPVLATNKSQITQHIKKLLKQTNSNFDLAAMPVYAQPAKITLKKPRR